MHSDPSLLQFMRGTFASSKLLRNLGIGCSISAIILGILASLSGKRALTLWTPFIMAGLHVLSFIFEYRSKIERSRAEDLRYLIMLEDGLGWEIHLQEEINMRAEASWLARRLARKADESPYYASPKPKGPERLLDHIRESVFFTKHLAQSASFWFLFGSCCVAVIGIGVLIGAVFVVSQREVLIAIANAAISVLLIAAAGPFFGDGLAFRRLAERCALLNESANNLSDRSIISVLKLLQRYNSTLLCAPPLPEFIYKLRRHELNRLWQSRTRREEELSTDEHD